MTRRVWITAGLATASAAALLLGGASAATAAPTAMAAAMECGVQTTHPAGAQGCFFYNGDHIIAYDTAPDGHHVEVYWTVGRYSGVCKNFTPYDQVHRQPSQHDCNYDFAENAQVCLRAAVVEGDTLVGTYSERRCYNTSGPDF